MNAFAKAVAYPLRAYFNPRFEALNTRLLGVEAGIGALAARPVEATPSDDSGPASLTPREAAELVQARLLAEVDVTEQNRDARWPSFETLESQAATAAQCDHPAYLAWCQLIEGWEGAPGGRQYNRKLWEWAFIAEAISRAGLLHEGASAVGFGVGTEPMPALLASHGVEVLATDQGLDSGSNWAATGELMGGIAGLSRPTMLPDAQLAERVRLREVDMNAVPADIGTFDIAWSSCVIEHLGSPQRGMDFVLESCALLRPGGIAVHTTEFELTRKSETMDYGHCAIYRMPDFVALEARLAEVGCEATFNFAVSMDSFADRWISLVHKGLRDDLPDAAHLKLALGDSVSTSYGLLIRKTAGAS